MMSTWLGNYLSYFDCIDISDKMRYETCLKYKIYLIGLYIQCKFSWCSIFVSLPLPYLKKADWADSLTFLPIISLTHTYREGKKLHCGNSLMLIQTYVSNFQKWWQWHEGRHPKINTKKCQSFEREMNQFEWRCRINVDLNLIILRTWMDLVLADRTWYASPSDTVWILAYYNIRHQNNK